MAIDKRLFDKYDDSVKTKGSRRDFPTGTFVVVGDKCESLETDDDQPQLYLKAHFTIISVERGEADVGGQHTVPYFKKKKFKFFERDTKRLAGAIRGLGTEETDSLKAGTVLKILDQELPGTVLRVRCKAQERQKKGEDDGVTSKWTDVEFVGRLDEEEVMAALDGDKKLLRQFFPQGLDKAGRGIGFGDDAGADDEDEDEAPKVKSKKAKPVVEDDDEDED